MRASRVGGVGGGGILRLLPMAIKFLGVKGTLIVGAAIVAYGLYSGNLNQILGGGSLPAAHHDASATSPSQSPQERELVEFVSVVLADTEDTWKQLFAQQGVSYAEPGLILFRDSVQSGCGFGSSQMGPFYCPADQNIYLDLSFYDDLAKRHNAPGDFAQAYVIAHEVGHHVQTLTGVSSKVHQARKGLSKVEINRLSVMQELQADCYAGIWAHHADRSREILESGDIEEGLAAASAIGDDRLQKQSRGHVSPDSFTHGSSSQRVSWFRTGLEKGSLKACDTFSAASL